MPNWEAETIKKVLRNPPPIPVEDVPPVQWAPERAPARATPLAPEGVESPLANWARRLIIGPRSIVEQTLREEAQTRQDAAKSREAMALEGRRETRARENLLLNIREQARVNAEAEARKQTEAQAARTRLMRGVIAAQPAPEGVESPLANWARRLIIGPRSIVEQTLREEAQTRQDAAKSREAMALEGRRETRARENLLLNIREQARVNAEAEARKQTEAQAARTRLMRGVIAAQPAPEGEPEMRPRREEIIQEPGGAEMYRALREKPEQVKGVSPEHDIIGPRGEIIRPGKPKEEKHTRAPYALDEAAQSLMDEAGTPILNPQTQAPYESFRDLPPGLKQQAWDKAARFQGSVGFERGRGTEEGKRSLPILKRGEWLNPFHFADSRIPLNPPPGTSVAAAEAAQYVNVTDRGDLDALAAIDTIPGVVQPLRVITDQVITAKTRLQLTGQALRGMGAAISAFVPGVSSFVQAEKLYNDSKRAFLANLARALGGERGVLTNVDREVIADALPSFTDTVGLKDAKWAIIDSIIANAREAKLKWMALGVGPSEEYAKAKANMLKQLMELGAPPRVKDSQGRVIPAPSGPILHRPKGGQ